MTSMTTPTTARAAAPASSMTASITRSMVFATRNRRELLRDPLSFVFGLGLPLLLLVLMSAMQRRIAVDIFRIEAFAPGIALFSFSFITLFAGMLLARDRDSAFLTRLFASPLSATDYIVGYSLPLMAIALVQSVICFGAALLLGLPADGRVLLAILVLLPMALLFVAIGLLLGSLFSDRQVGGVASILVQVVALGSGMWFDLALLGNTVQAIGYALPFAHALDATRAALTGELATIPGHLAWVLGYTVVVFAAAIWAFRRRMKG